MIDIIIPCFNAHNSLPMTLNSIIIQSIKSKVKVLLVDDCSDHNYNDIVKKYSKYIDISEIRLEENSGPGIARQIGIDNTNSDYIMFIDSDDILFNYNTLEVLYNEIESGYDHVNSIEYDEKRESYLILNGNIHGKIYRRKYLLDNNIKFNNTRYHEDNFFNNHVVLSGARTSLLYICTYYYTYNKESITNNNSKEFDRLEIYLKNMNDLIDLVYKLNYSKYRLARFKREKYRYLKRIYKTFTDSEKETFKKWIQKYDSDFLSFIELDEDAFYEKLDKYLDEIIKD